MAEHHRMMKAENEKEEKDKQEMEKKVKQEMEDLLCQLANCRSASSRRPAPQKHQTAQSAAQAAQSLKKTLLLG